VKNEIRKGIENILAAIRDDRQTEEEALFKEFVAQQPRLDEKVAYRVLLEQTIHKILDLKYDLYPSLDDLKRSNPVEYRRAYNTVLKIEDSIGKTLGRLGLTLSPQKYIPTEERKTFDAKASKVARKKAGSFIEQVKKKAEEKPVEVKESGD